MNIFSQQPADVLDYGVDLTKWLVSGDTVNQATVKVSPSGLNAVVTQENTSEPKVWLSGGVDDVEYQVTLTVITTGGRTKEFEFKLAVVEL
tara:strand:- start:252 stop:524 length:273 start_codon:yes stop_codon:yes gene_type:complete